MKNKVAILSSLVVASLLIASCTLTGNQAPLAIEVFPTPTNHFLLQGKAPVDTSDSPVTLSGVPTTASIFRAASSATPTPIVLATATSTSTTIPASTETQPPAPQSFTVAIYEDDLNPNWAVQKDTRLRFDLKSSSAVYRGHTAISFAPRSRGDATMFLTVTDQTTEEYRRDQLTKLSFWLYSPKNLLYLDQFSITFVGSKRLPYWSAEDQKTANFLSAFPHINLEQLGFDRAIPADTWVMVEIDLDTARLLAPEYQYLTGISFQNATAPTHPLLIDNLNLTLLGRPPQRSTLEIAPRLDSE